MQSQAMMPDEDLAYTVLSNLKRVCGEYMTAATESNCPHIRELFTSLMNSTLKLQGKLYAAMQQQNMYSSASSALKQDIAKQIREYEQTGQKTMQYLQQLKGHQHQQQHQQSRQHVAFNPSAQHQHNQTSAYIQQSYMPYGGQQNEQPMYNNRGYQPSQGNQANSSQPYSNQQQQGNNNYM